VDGRVKPGHDSGGWAADASKCGRDGSGVSVPFAASSGCAGLALAVLRGSPFRLAPQDEGGEWAPCARNEVLGLRRTMPCSASRHPPVQPEDRGSVRCPDRNGGGQRSSAFAEDDGWGVERRARTSLLANVPDISVIARLDRAIHAMTSGLHWHLPDASAPLRRHGMDGRVKPGHDSGGWAADASVVSPFPSRHPPSGLDWRWLSFEAAFGSILRSSRRTSLRMRRLVDSVDGCSWNCLIILG
jgi:hypothetical protein